MPTWTHHESETLFNVPNWGRGYFRINAEGNVEVTPDGPTQPGGAAIDVYKLMGEIQRRGVQPPILMRFDGILRARVREINDAFNRARAELDYEAPYRLVFPIKVNQQRHVVEELLKEGRKYGMGIEVGSKPELLAVVALQPPGENALVICNGYKDREYVETALLASKLGATVVIVIEKFSEIHTVLSAADELNIRPIIGVRTKLSGVGSGRWKESGGDRSKFGLTTRNIVQIVELLREKGKLDCLQLLHFHLGSQITHIRALKNALREGTRTLIGLREMGAPVEYFDVGGGLGVDYDGSSTNFESSMNYSLQEYANDVVFHIAEACIEAGIPMPTILSESGRALTAHHSVLVAEVLGVTDYSNATGPVEKPGEDDPAVLRNFHETYESANAKNFQESYNDAVQLREEGMTLFNVGQLSLPDRARVEEYFWRTCEKILRITRSLPYVPDELEGLERDLADTYFLNFSVFQSLPDSWAIQQLFPIVPIHRLNEQPTRRAVLADITCDSDGKIDRFIDLKDVKRTLELHPLQPNEPYYVGFFLVGAYQEILGDLHNLFGDTNVVHVDVAEDGRPKLTHVVRGDRVEEVLSYVEYYEPDLLADLRRNIEKAISEDKITFEESARLLRRYEAGLASYTYLVRDREAELNSNGLNSNGQSSNGQGSSGQGSAGPSSSGPARANLMPAPPRPANA
ncbi:MAG: biosynthetic arginine decarboxylase, partial [Planctomycetota bacterium]